MSYSPPTAALTLALGALVGCWAGASSEGLPCTNNDQCGLGLECVNDYCGGVPTDGLCGNGWLDPGEDCDDGEQNAQGAACRPDCTAGACGDGELGPGEECDEGADNSNQGSCKADCSEQVCGDGFTGPAEGCDDGNTLPDDGCSPVCVLESCGNGIVDPGEECDDGGESASCDEDCTVAECGDQRVNAAAGEDCDNDAPAADDASCLANCTTPLLWDDLEPETEQLEWTSEVVSGPIFDSWVVGPRNAQGQRSWDSGIPAEDSGDIRLISPPIDLGALTGQSAQLRFDQARRFTDCVDQDVAHEGGVVEVSVDGGPFEVVVPVNGYNGQVNTDCMMDGPNPLAGQDAFVLNSVYVTELVDLSNYVGSSIRVGFRAGWNCGNCNEMDQSERGWFIDNIVVLRQPN